MFESLIQRVSSLVMQKDQVFKTLLVFIYGFCRGIAVGRDILRGQSLIKLRVLADNEKLRPIVRYKVHIANENQDGDRIYSSVNRSAAIAKIVQNITLTLQLHGIQTTSATRVFRHAGFHETRHIAAGLDCWYSHEILQAHVPMEQQKKKSLREEHKRHERTKFRGDLPTSRQHAHLAVDAVDVLLNASSGCYHHLNILEVAAIPRMYEYVPSDTYYSSYQRTDFRSTNVPGAWDRQAGSNNIVVQVIDSGLFGSSKKGDHPDLQDNIWINSGEIDCDDGVDNDGNGFVDDCHGYNFADDTSSLVGDSDHGTHVAGTVAADTDNSIGVAGVAVGIGG